MKASCIPNQFFNIKANFWLNCGITIVGFFLSKHYCSLLVYLKNYNLFNISTAKAVLNKIPIGILISFFHGENKAAEKWISIANILDTIQSSVKNSISILGKYTMLRQTHCNDDQEKESIKAVTEREDAQCSCLHFQKK